MTNRYLVQYNDGGYSGWFDCVREDLLEQFDGRTADLPVAKFSTLREADDFISTMCGLMHCGGNKDDFRIAYCGISGRHTVSA
jgi:hypothetical protein